MKLLTTFVLKVQRDGVGGGGFVGRGSAGSVCGAVVPLTMFRLCFSTPVYCNFGTNVPQQTQRRTSEAGRQLIFISILLLFLVLDRWVG